MSGARHDKQLALALRRREDLPPHPTRYHMIAIAVGNPHGHIQPAHATHGVVMDARHEPPPPADAGNSESPSHRLRRRDRCLKDKRARLRLDGELGRTPAAEGMAEADEPV